MLPAEVRRHRFDVEEYHRMGEVGILSEEDRVELLQEILDGPDRPPALRLR